MKIITASIGYFVAAAAVASPGEAVGVDQEDKKGLRIRFPGPMQIGQLNHGIRYATDTPEDILKSDECIAFGQKLTEKMEEVLAMDNEDIIIENFNKAAREESKNFIDADEAAGGESEKGGATGKCEKALLKILEREYDQINGDAILESTSCCAKEVSEEIDELREKIPDLANLLATDTEVKWWAVAYTGINIAITAIPLVLHML